MEENFKKLLKGYKDFRKKYAHGNKSVMRYLSLYGQKPKTMVIACCDSRVDPALILQCDPGDLFVVRNVANIVPPYERDNAYHGTSAALEFGICFLKIKHLILLGHSQCGGIQALLENKNLIKGNSCHNDFITKWVSVIEDTSFIDDPNNLAKVDEYAKLALKASYKNCMTFPWLQQKVSSQELYVHLWFFDIKTGEIFTYSGSEYKPLDDKIGQDL